MSDSVISDTAYVYLFTYSKLHFRFYSGTRVLDKVLDRIIE